MKIKTRYPPNINKIRERFGEIPNSVVFTYGDILYAPKGKNIPKNLRVHEKVHMKQQGDDPEGWWDKYLTDVDFRLEQEVEAYKKQFGFYRSTCKIKSRIPLFLNRIAKDLSGSIYGNMIGFNDAKKLIEGQ